MASNRRIMVLPGDGIGNEVMAANMKLIEWLAKHRSLVFDISEGLVGGAAYDLHGVPLTEETLYSIHLSTYTYIYICIYILCMS